MNSGLTLNLTRETIETAKSYAKSNQTNVSKLVKNYLNNLTSTSKKKSTVSPLVESQTGIIPNDFDKD